MTAVAKSKWVVTGSRFWTTMIATKIAKIEAPMIFKLRILLYLKAIGTLRREYERGSRGRGRLMVAPC
jgi:hypothetical protein